MSDAWQRLERPVAEYVAGELPDDEAAAVCAAIDSDEDLAAECAFWERMRPALREHGRPPHARTPGGDMAAVIRRRLAQTPPAEPAAPIRFPGVAMAGWAVAAAAGVLLAISLTRAPEPRPVGDRLIAYAEDGSALVLPRQRASVVPASYPPAQTPDQPLERPVGHGQRRPWLGVWFRPQSLKGFDQDSGLRVLRVAMGSPAHAAGVRPGDILLEFGDCSLTTRYCITHAMGAMRAGAEQLSLRYWRAASAEVVTVRVDPGGCLE